MENKKDKKILLVDDELFNINALKIILRCFTKINPETDCEVARNGK
jgi:PleD family two-component response regulator